LQWIFGFHFGLGVLGLWYAQTCGALFQLFSLLFLLYRWYDWEKITQGIGARIERDRQVTKKLGGPSYTNDIEV
jgi:hypothetical protein